MTTKKRVVHTAVWRRVKRGLPPRAEPAKNAPRRDHPDKRSAVWFSQPPGGMETRAALQGLQGRPHQPFTSESLTQAWGCDMIDGVREVPIGTLKPGRKFELVLTATTPKPHKRIRGLLVRVGPGTVAVVLEGSERERSFQTAEGQQVVLHTTGGVVYWSPGTPVLPLSDKDGKAVTADVTRWTTKQGLGVQEDPHHPANFEADNAQSAPGEEKDMAQRNATLPGLGKSSKGHSQHKAKTKGKAKPSAPKELHPCLCGCGERVAGRFRQGHDGKYYSLLKQVSRGDMQFNELPRQMQANLGSVAGVKKALAASGH